GKRNQCERRGGAQRTDGMEGVAPEQVEPNRSHITHGLRGRRETTKVAEGHSLRFGPGKSARNMRLDLLFQVKPQFLVHLGADPASPSDTANVCGEPCKHHRTPALWRSLELSSLQNPFDRKCELFPTGGFIGQTA